MAKDKELLLKLGSLDEETLRLITKITEERAKSFAIQSIITGVLASAVGVISLSEKFLTNSWVSIAAWLVLGGVIGFAIVWWSERQNRRLIQTIIEHAEAKSASTEELSESKKALIKEFIRVRGI